MKWILLWKVIICKKEKNESTRRIKNYPEDNTSIVRLFDDGTSYLLIDQWPMEDEQKFKEEEMDDFKSLFKPIIRSRGNTRR